MENNRSSREKNGGQALSSEPGLVSIVIPCCGMLDYLKLCLPSILQNSREPYELIFLDVGSLDGTAEYIAGVKTAARQHVEVIAIQATSEITSACQAAISVARGEFIVLVNNDIIVTPGWLDCLVALASKSPQIGIVGPMSNYAPVHQHVPLIPYRIGQRRHMPISGEVDGEFVMDTMAVNSFAREWHEKNRGTCAEVERVAGFCLLIKRQVIFKLEKTWPVEKRPELGFFDTDNLCSKARQAGFVIACCRDTFVHNFGTRPFSKGAAMSN